MSYNRSQESIAPGVFQYTIKAGVSYGWRCARCGDGARGYVGRTGAENDSRDHATRCAPLRNLQRGTRPATSQNPAPSQKFSPS